MKGFYKNGLKRIEAKLTKSQVEKARREAKQEIFNIRLAELRKKANLRQEDISSFSQSSLSKLESRKDMKISTLIEYLKSIGMRVEIRALPLKGTGAKKGVVLVKS